MNDVGNDDGNKEAKENKEDEEQLHRTLCLLQSGFTYSLHLLSQQLEGWCCTSHFPTQASIKKVCDLFQSTKF